VHPHCDRIDWDRVWDIERETIFHTHMDGLRSTGVNGTLGV
jgi:hypothetical protein